MRMTIEHMLEEFTHRSLLVTAPSRGARRWGDTIDALGWLYRVEKRLEGDPGYFDATHADREGRTTTALTYFRGLVDHGRVDSMHEVIELPGEYGSARALVKAGYGQMIDITLAMEFEQWPTLPPIFGDKHGRDEYYRTHVQGTPLISALVIARSFMYRVVGVEAPPIGRAG